MNTLKAVRSNFSMIAVEDRHEKVHEITFVGATAVPSLEGGEVVFKESLNTYSLSMTSEALKQLIENLQKVLDHK